MTRREVLEAVKKALHTEAPTGATSSTKRTSPTIGVAVSKTLELGATNSTERTSLTGTMSSTDSTDSTDSIAPANLTDMVSSTAEQAPARQEIPWEYGKKTNIPDVLARFIERVIDYKATVRRAANSEEAAALVAEMLVQAKAASCVVPPGLDRQWYQQASEAGIHVCVDNPPLSKEALNNTAAVITAASVGIAETGTTALIRGGASFRCCRIPISALSAQTRS